MDQLNLDTRMFMSRITVIVGSIRVRMYNGNSVDDMTMRKESHGSEISDKDHRQDNL